MIPTYKHSPVRDSFEKGMEFQDYVCLRLAKEGIILQNISSKRFQFEVGENLQGFEIKLDRRCTETEQLSIEVAEKSSRDVLIWTDSGIMREDNSWLYIQGNYDAFWVFARDWLLRYYGAKSPDVSEFNGTIRRWFLPIDHADKYALKKYEATP